MRVAPTHSPKAFDFGMSLWRLSGSAVILAFIILLSLFWMAGAPIPPEARYACWVMILLAALVLAVRGASDLSPATWIVVIAAYPILVPLFTLDVLGFPAFATGSRAHQSIEAITVPTLIGASATLFLALGLSVRPISLPERVVLLRRNLALRGGTALVFFLGASMLFLVANFIDAPVAALQIGQVSYRDLKGAREDTLNAASGLVMVFSAISTIALISVQSAPGLGLGTRRACMFGFTIVTVLVVCWQIFAASRIEVVGLLLLVYLIFADRLHGLLRLAVVFGVIAVLTFVGYFRTLIGTLAYLSRDFVSWPGGVENVFNTYVFGLNAVKDGSVPIQVGQTYLNLLERLPPQALGLARPDRAYDLLATQTHLIGGEYFLFEPFLNFLGFGVVAALLGLVWVVNRAVQALGVFVLTGRGYFSTLIALVLFTVCFRMLWYGSEHTVKVLLLATLLALPLAMLERSGRVPGARRPRFWLTYKYRSQRGR